MNECILSGTLYIPISSMHYTLNHKVRGSFMPGSNPPFMSGVPELLVLRLLTQKEMYGYELVQAIQQVTGGSIAVGEGVVYPLLHSLERSGILKSRRLQVNGRTRVYYQARDKGKKRLNVLLDRWRRIQSGVESALSDSSLASAEKGYS